MKKKIKSIILNTIQLTCLGGAFVHIFQPELTFATNLYHINAFIYLISAILLAFSITVFSITIPVFVRDGASESNIKNLKRITSLQIDLNTTLNRIYYIICILYISACVLFSSIIGTSPILVLLHVCFRTILQFFIIPWAESEMNKMQSELDKHNEALKQNPWFQELKKVRGEY